MEIIWLGHSCFRLKGSQTIVTDPFPPDLGYSLGKQSSQIVTVSHAHPSHSYTQAYTQCVEGAPKIIRGPGEYEIGGVLILGIPSFHDAEGGARLGRNTVFLFEMDGLSICHLGDLGHSLSAAQIAEIGNVDILLVPVGGVSTINAAQAAEVVRRLEARAVIPMHYKTPALQRELEPVDQFLKEMGSQQVIPQPKLTVTKSNLPENTKVFLLSC